MVGLAMVVKWEQLICRWGRASFNSWRVPSGTIPKTCSVFNVGISPSSLERKRETFRVAVSMVTVPLELHDPIFTHCIIFYTIQTEDIICNQWFEETAKVNPQSTGHSLGNMALGNTQVYFAEFLITKKLLDLFKIQTYFLSFSIPGLYPLHPHSWFILQNVTVLGGEASKLVIVNVLLWHKLESPKVTWNLRIWT